MKLQQTTVSDSEFHFRRFPSSAEIPEKYNNETRLEKSSHPYQRWGWPLKEESGLGDEKWQSTELQE